MTTETKRTSSLSTAETDKTEKNLRHLTSALEEIFTSEKNFIDQINRLNTALSPGQLKELDEKASSQLLRFTTPYQKLLFRDQESQYQPSQSLLKYIPSIKRRGSTESKSHEASQTVTALTATQAKEAITDAITWIENRNYAQLQIGTLLFTEASKKIPLLFSENGPLAKKITEVLGKDSLQQLLPVIMQRAPRYRLLLNEVELYLKSIDPDRNLTDAQLTQEQRANRHFVAQQRLRIKAIVREVARINIVHGLHEYQLSTPKDHEDANPEFIFGCLKASLSYLIEDLTNQEIDNSAQTVTTRVSSKIDFGARETIQKKLAAMRKLLGQLRDAKDIVQVTEVINRLKDHTLLNNLYSPLSTHLEKLIDCVKQAIPTVEITKLSSPASITDSTVLSETKSNIATTLPTAEEKQEAEILETPAEKKLREEVLPFLIAKAQLLFEGNFEALTANDFIPAANATLQKFPQVADISKFSLMAMENDAATRLKHRVPKKHLSEFCHHLCSALTLRQRAASAPAALASFAATADATASNTNRRESAPPLPAAATKSIVPKRAPPPPPSQQSAGMTKPATASAGAAGASFFAGTTNAMAGSEKKAETASAQATPPKQIPPPRPPRPASASAVSRQSAGAATAETAVDASSQLPPRPSSAGSSTKSSALFGSTTSENKGTSQPKQSAPAPAGAPSTAATPGKT